MGLFKTQAMADRAKDIPPAQVRTLLNPGIFVLKVERVEESTKNSTNIAAFIQLNSTGRDEETGNLFKLFKVGDPDTSVADIEIADLKAFVAALGFDPNDAGDLEASHLAGKTCLCGIEVVSRKDGSLFNVIGHGAYWKISENPRDINWEPREQQPQQRGFGRR